ncbi:tetratricopeptide repeat-containing sensor histidine kinase [Arcticibacter eurypsychrophilus]|uniref:tetratricopeptide repeat-containing sensor histidine kinase n=1 Tax=Arcticibacter eurypsychrophilus TaxID=1434752 RepID=UPI00084DB6D1|nr:tetratricopeptide repeat-containing sensor histidine kinase [Arcticibacter eurypsychrophilus]
MREKKNDNFYYDQAFTYREKGMIDSSFFYFIKAKDLFLQQKDSLGAGKCLVNMAIISNDKGDYFGSQEISLNAISYFDVKNEDQYVFIRSNYNNLGIATQKLGDAEHALGFYNSAIRFSRDSLDTRVYRNNMATSYQLLGDHRAAISVYKIILMEASKNKKEYARALTNISYNKWRLNPSYNPLTGYLIALRIRQNEKDLWGQNSSFLHLSEYYFEKMPDSALLYAKLSYRVAKELNSADDQLIALQKLVRLSPVQETKQYFERYKSVNDSIQNARGKAKNQFALIRYQTEKHKADFLNAQAENIHRRNNILIQNFILAILIAILIVGYIWYKKRKKILQQEQELEVKNTKLKYVKKIHDRVANKVYHVMSEVENSPQVDRDGLLDKLEVIYNISRDISYENEEVISADNYAEQLSKMLQSYSSEITEVLLVGNEEELWIEIGNASKTELLLIMQELMTNMRKHSYAETVVIKFQKSDSTVSILYSDNGVGMKDAAKKNGLANTENRIKSILGTITFDNINEKGLMINLSFPFS